MKQQPSWAYTPSPVSTAEIPSDFWGYTHCIGFSENKILANLMLCHFTHFAIMHFFFRLSPIFRQTRLSIIFLVIDIYIYI